MQVKGYESRVLVQLTGGEDLTSASLFGQVREYGCDDDEILTVLSTALGTIEVVSTAVSGAEVGSEYQTEITLIFEGPVTADWPDVVRLDLVRDDLSPEQYMGFQLQIPFATPITRQVS